MTTPTTADKPVAVIDTTELANLRAELAKLRAEREAAHAMLDRMGIGSGGLVGRIIELEDTAARDAANRLAPRGPAAGAREWGAGYANHGWGAGAVGGGL